MKMKFNSKQNILLVIMLGYILYLKSSILDIRTMAFALTPNETTLHSVGSYRDGCINVGKSETGNVVSGQFVNLKNGDYVARFKLIGYDGEKSADVGSIDVFNTLNNGYVLVSRRFSISSPAKGHSVFFTVDNALNVQSLDFRVFSDGLADFKYCGVTINKFD